MSASERNRVSFSLGSNQGDRFALLGRGLRGLLAPNDMVPVAISPVFETDPVGGPEQPDFLNAVLVVDTTLQPRVLLERALEVERRFGRVRQERWAPRTLDIDVLAIGLVVVDEPGLKVPHPRAAERAFVLVPWVRADPTALLPGSGPVAELVRRLDCSGVRERPDLVLELTESPS